MSRQHLATSQLRAVESGRTVVHASISGVSAVVTPDGRAHHTTGLYQPALVSATVEPRSGLTVYDRAGRLVEAALVGVTAALLAAWAWHLIGARAARARPGPAGSDRSDVPGTAAAVAGRSEHDSDQDGTLAST
jgi:apolipoprotein N-acyltransferase